MEESNGTDLWELAWTMEGCRPRSWRDAGTTTNDGVAAGVAKEEQAAIAMAIPATGNYRELTAGRKERWREGTEESGEGRWRWRGGNDDNQTIWMTLPARSLWITDHDSLVTHGLVHLGFLELAQHRGIVHLGFWACTPHNLDFPPRIIIF